jgi:hypothetical protein
VLETRFTTLVGCSVPIQQIVRELADGAERLLGAQSVR